MCMQVKKQQLEPDMEKWTDSKLGKEYVKAVYNLVKQASLFFHMAAWQSTI